MKILLTRHGQTDWNVLGKVQGITDIELNETGIRQAQMIREKLLDYDIDLILTSPLKRAKKTAEIIGSGRNIPIIVENELIERAFGNHEGKTREEFAFRRMWDYELDKQEEGLESVKTLFNRVDNFIEKIKNEYPDKTVLLVTHGGVTVPIRSYFEGRPETEEGMIHMGIGNCEVKEYDI